MKWLRMTVLLFLSLASLLSFAAATLIESRGDVTIRAQNGTLSPGTVNARVLQGGSIVTGADGLVIMRFDDGHQIALEKNTEFKVDQFRYNAAAPAEGSMFLSMLRGALRSVTGLMGSRNKSSFRLTTPTATIGIRGSDWMAALQNNTLYTGVQSGGIAVNDSIGSLLVDAGQYSAGLAGQASQLVSFSQLPVGVFGSLPSLSMAGVTAASSAGSASGGAGAAGGSAGISAVTAGAVAAGVGVAAVVSSTSSDGDSTPVHHSTTVHH